VARVWGRKAILGNAKQFFYQFWASCFSFIATAITTGRGPLDLGTLGMVVTSTFPAPIKNRGSISKGIEK
jgi:hypothetical protein